jgi:ArsR family transcriptional regulator
MATTASNANGEDWLARLAAMSDRSRVRIMRVLEQEELGVGELSRVMGMPQSTVSRHLKPLYELNLVSKRSEGTTSLYRLNVSQDADMSLWQATISQLGEAEDFKDDASRMRQVLLERRADSRSFFGRVGGEWQSIRRDLFGFGFSDDALLGLLPVDWTVADLGCGTGDAAERLAPVVRTVYAIDREPAMIAAARKRLDGFGNIEYLEADLLDLPLDSKTVDVSVLMLVLHHHDDPAGVIAEAARILVPGGRILLVDMVAHERNEFADEMGHRHLGFTRGTVEAWASSCGLKLHGHRRLRPSTQGRGPALFAAILSG